MIRLYVYEIKNVMHQFSFYSKHSGNILAEQAAQDFYDNHKGDEYSWPKTFTIFNAQHEKVGQYYLEKVMFPVFEAKEIK